MATGVADRLWSIAELIERSRIIPAQGTNSRAPNILQREDMDLIIFWFPIVGGGIFATIAISAAFTEDHKSLAIWCGYIATIMLGFVFCLQLQEKIWNFENMPGSPPTPKLPEPLVFRERSDVVTFTLGGEGVTTTVERLSKDTWQPFLIDGFSPVTLSVVDDRLMVDFTTWGGADKPRIEVRDCDFVVRPDGWDKNSNANALEIVNDVGQPHVSTNPQVPYACRH